MFSKTPTSRASKGSVSIINTHDRLQLRFNFGGKRHYLTLGLPDTLVNCKLAQFKAAEIEKDILYERFDDTLEKYKPQSALSTIPPILPMHKYKPQLNELWARYSEFKKPQISPSIYTKVFTRHRNHISRFPTQSLDEASTIRDHMLATLTADAAKCCLTQLKACCDWAVEEGAIEVNPFGLPKLKVPKGLDEDADVNPFTKAERDLIITTFAGDRYYRHYTNYVRFLFYTGCRPLEAIALKWKHIKGGVIKFRESVVISEDVLVWKEGLKTQRKRDFPVTSERRCCMKDELGDAT